MSRQLKVAAVTAFQRHYLHLSIENEFVHIFFLYSKGLYNKHGLCTFKQKFVNTLCTFKHFFLYMHNMRIHHTRMHCTQMYGTQMHGTRMHRTDMHLTRMHRTQMYGTRIHRTGMYLTRMITLYTDDDDR